MSTWKKKGLGEEFLTGRQVVTHVGSWWNLLLGRSEVQDTGLEAKVKTTKSNVTLECKEYE